MENDLDTVFLLTLTEIAELMHVSKRTVLRMIRSENFPAFKIGSQWRINESQLVQWIEGCESAWTHDTPGPDTVSGCSM